MSHNPQCMLVRKPNKSLISDNPWREVTPNYFSCWEGRGCASDPPQHWNRRSGTLLRNVSKNNTLFGRVPYNHEDSWTKLGFIQSRDKIWTSSAQFFLHTIVGIHLRMLQQPIFFKTLHISLTINFHYYSWLLPGVGNYI